MALGLGLLRLSPRDYWAMTPRELAAALGVLPAGDEALPPDRAAFAALMQRFPDQGGLNG